MGALRLMSRRWALPLRQRADAPYMQRGQDDPVTDTCQSGRNLPHPAYGRGWHEQTTRLDSVAAMLR
jgi:hypothetical protein